MSDEEDENRFVDYDSDGIEQERQKVKRKNTEKSDKKCDKVFVEYLHQTCSDKVPNYEYWNYDPTLLDGILCKFWFAARRQNKDRYTIASLKHLRYGLNRCIKKKGMQFDLLKSECFAKNQQCFDDACKLLKQLGYGVVKHYPEIKPKGKYFKLLINFL